MIGLTRLLLTPPHGQVAMGLKPGVSRVDCDDPQEAETIAAWYAAREWTVEIEEL